MTDMTEPPLRVVFAWHMHQPHYADSSGGDYELPWTYLHAMKDYVDMAAHLEAVDGARAVVNFAPTLLEQIDDYAEQVQAWLRTGRVIHDPVLNALGGPVLPTDAGQRCDLIKASLRVNRQRVIERFPAFTRLAHIADTFVETPEDVIYLDDQYITDLLVWYHLGWIAETVRRTDERIMDLMEKGRRFTLADRRSLMSVISELLNSIIPRYRKLYEDGKVELSVTPYAHPIGPLMLDFETGKDAWPECVLPEAPEYPGGEERFRWHITHGLKVFEKYFGHRPKGCWPAEGGVSQSVWDILGEYGFEWVATGEGILGNTLSRAGRDDLNQHRSWLHRPYQSANSDIRCFFRDDGLSDKIGFEYSTWHADDAVADLVQNLKNIAEANKDKPCTVVSIILDGENAWEYYPENAYYFLSALYAKVAEQPGLELTTFNRCLEGGRGGATEIAPNLVAGSWVYGTFSTWIGNRDKNRGWDMLVEAKQAFDAARAAGTLDDTQLLERAETQLAICEGSDWFWWFGDDNPGESVSDFERLFRRHLATLYHLVGTQPPEYLSHSFTTGGNETVATGGVMRKGRNT